MSVLKKQVQQRLEAQNRQQKQLAMELSGVVVGGEKPPAHATVEKNLALLGSNDESASKFFFDHPPRLERLAKELQVDVDAVKAWKDAPTLVLGPGLPPEFVEFAKRLETSEAFTRFDVDERWTTKEELRDAAQAETNAILVLSAQSQVQFNEFLSGAGVIGKVQTVHQVPRGWRLSAHDGLLKIPPPREPDFFTSDGYPLFRHPKGTKRFDKREEELLFSLKEFNEAIGAGLFWDQGALWSWHPISFDAALLAPHKAPRIIEPEFLEIVKGRSPVGFTRQSFMEFVAAAQLRFHGNMWSWLGGEPGSDENQYQSNSSKQRRAVLPPRLKAAQVTACLPDEEATPRELLRSLIRRAWQVEHLPSFTTQILELRALADAEWGTVKTNSTRWDLTANMGAGRLFFATLWHFENETPRAVRHPNLPNEFEERPDNFRYDGRWFDGGDALLFLIPGDSPMLEGAVHRPRERRREAERRAQDD